MPLALAKYRHLATLLGVVAVGLGLYALWPTANTAVQVDPAAASSGWQQSGVANPFGSAAAEASASSPASLLATSLPPSLSNTSLAGTQPDGDWGLDARGQLRASRGIRQRFDYYLSLIGEKSLSEIEALLLHDAHTGLPPVVFDLHQVNVAACPLQRDDRCKATDPTTNNKNARNVLGLHG